MARWCVRAGAQVTVADTRSAPPQLALLQAELPSVRFIAGPLSAELVAGQDVRSVYRSPGLAPQEIAPVVRCRPRHRSAGGRRAGFVCQSPGRLAQQHGYAPKVLAITGTNGKTTVTALTGQLLEHAGWSVAVAGNIGPSLLDTLAHHLDAENLPQAWVLELSSFQLEGVQDFAPSAAVVLNITQDHLDWHGSMAAYAAAKARIFGAQGCMVLNRQDEAVMAMLPAPVKLKGGKLQPRCAHHLWQQPAAAAGRLWPGRSQWHGLAGACARRGNAGRRRRCAGRSCTFSACCPPMRCAFAAATTPCNALAALALAQAAGRPLAPPAVRLARIPGRAAPGASPSGMVRWRGVFRRQQRHQRGRHRGRAERAGAERRIVLILGGAGQRAGLRPAGRAGGAACARRGADRARCAR